MKKQLLIFSVFASALFVSCSDEEIISSNDTSTDLEVTIEQIDFNPETAEPNSRFNDTSEGLYHGVFVTLDTEIHAKIWININNDGQYNATVVSNQGDRFRFLGKEVSRDGTKFSFVGERGSFDFDVSDIENPVATHVIVDAKEAHIATVKDREGQRAAVILGSFTTDDDPMDVISGTWDLMTDGTPNPNAFNFPLLTEVVITVANNGNVYSDTDFETFDYPCFFSVNDVAPVFLHEDPMTTPNGRNEFWAQDQSFALGNATLTYWLGQSSGAVDTNPTLTNHGFHNNDFADPPVAGCTAIDGKKGVWFWNGRSGFSSFDDPFDVPMRAVENIDYEGFKEAISEMTFQK
ncbi:hypothetical protein [uncultured Dokdonia sp.]|uniref:hypothetical protein n=1 Tax=uncultured Dokdonia sp. TaxID=575653 RepID=UPI00262A6C92|nr:hypothetical protein [uncultured Dokdonia sp.]